MEGFEKALQIRAEQAERIVLSYLPAEEGREKKIYEAMNYSVKGGGKRLRPILMLEAFRLFGGEEEKIHPFMAALEMIHSYSLIHDDLPEMDNDDLRRGRATCHVVFGQAMAVLAGDGLLNLAFETAISAVSGAEPEDMAKAAKAACVLARKAGCRGMIGGQVADIEAEEKGNIADDGELLFIQEKKTGALLEAALMIGGIMGDADDEQVQRLERIGRWVGTAFQIRDDILDVTGDEAQLGKPIGSDEKNDKLTYVSLHGLEAAAKRVAQLSGQAERELSLLPGDTTFLKALFSYLIERNK